MSTPAVRWRTLALAELERRRLARNGGTDAATRLIAELDLMAERLRADPNLVEPTPEESEENMRWIEDWLATRRHTNASAPNQ